MNCFFCAQDIFAGLISLIFIIDGILPILRNFIEETIPLRSAMFETLLFVITFGGLAVRRPGKRWPKPEQPSPACMTGPTNSEPEVPVVCVPCDPKIHSDTKEARPTSRTSAAPHGPSAPSAARPLRILGGTRSAEAS